MAGTVALALHEEGQFVIPDIKKFTDRLRRDDIKNADICVFGILGKFRQGKSTLLNITNKFLKNANGGKIDLKEKDGWLFQPDNQALLFEAATGTEGVTRGISITQDPMMIQDQDGKPFAVFLIDTQGLFDPSATMEINTYLFVLTSMLSSFTVLNVMPNIDTRDIELLAAFCKLTREIRDSGIDVRNKVFRQLVVLTRDGELAGAFGWRKGQEVLETCLRKQTANGVLSEYELRSAFQELRAFQMPRISPSPEVKDFTISNSGPNAVNETFRKQVCDFLKGIFSKPMLQPFMYNGVPIQCGAFADYLELVVKLFEDGSVPQATDMVTAMKTQEYVTAKARALAFYNANMSQAVREMKEPDHMVALHELYLSTCLSDQNVNATILTRDPSAAKILDSFKQEVQDAYNGYVKLNNARRDDAEKAEKKRKEVEAKLAVAEKEKSKMELNRLEAMKEVQAAELKIKMAQNEAERREAEAEARHANEMREHVEQALRLSEETVQKFKEQADTFRRDAEENKKQFERMYEQTNRAIEKMSRPSGCSIM